MGEKVASQQFSEFFEENQTQIMTVSFASIGVVWVMLHLYFGVLVYHAVRRTKVALKGLKTASEYQKIFKHKMKKRVSQRDSSSPVKKGQQRAPNAIMPFAK